MKYFWQIDGAVVGLRPSDWLASDAASVETPAKLDRAPHLGN
jgi:hypothetical protein